MRSSLLILLMICYSLQIRLLSGCWLHTVHSLLIAASPAEIPFHLVGCGAETRLGGLGYSMRSVNKFFLPCSCTCTRKTIPITHAISLRHLGEY